MKYIIISDIHANLEALEAVINDFSGQKEKEVFCAGDIVGYGADPGHCIDQMDENRVRCVLGNHDAVVVEKHKSYNFNNLARIAAEWTKNNIGRRHQDLLSRLSLEMETDVFELVHGSLDFPGRFKYIVDKSSAWQTFFRLRKQICFVGHSHIPGVFVLKKDDVSYNVRTKFKVDKSSKYIINSGSVGQPRDDDARACYCVYDDDLGVVELRRVKYDVKKAAVKILRAGLPESLAERLYRGC